MACRIDDRLPGRDFRGPRRNFTGQILACHDVPGRQKRARMMLEIGIDLQTRLLRATSRKDDRMSGDRRPGRYVAFQKSEVAEYCRQSKSDARSARYQQ